MFAVQTTSFARKNPDAVLPRDTRVRRMIPYHSRLGLGKKKLTLLVV